MSLVAPRAAFRTKQFRAAIAEQPFIVSLDELHQRRAACLRPALQLKDINATVARFAAADDVLTDLEFLREFGLAQICSRSQFSEFLEEDAVLLRLGTRSHPALAAYAIRQNQVQTELWENHITHRSPVLGRS